MSDTKDPDKPVGWPDRITMEDFDKGRREGTVTVFRVSLCGKCKREIPKVFEACSYECAVELAAKEESTT